jgi:phytoene dehydrogenase-like protein
MNTREVPDSGARELAGSWDVVVIGAGHNGLTAAAYLARAGRRVLVLEATQTVGGAAISTQAFPGVDARLSRYSYLVSLMPTAIIDELDLGIELRSRHVASYTPLRRGDRDTGLLVERSPGSATEASFREVTGGDRDYRHWQDLYGRIERAARVLAPTMLQRLPSREEARDLVVAAAGVDTWDQIAETPLGETLIESFSDDDVRGVVATDGLIGTYASLFDASLLANRCWLYHLVGDGTGEWKVPVGGMGAVSGALHRAAVAAGAQIHTSARVTFVDTDGRYAHVSWTDADGHEQAVDTTWVLCNASPNTLDVLRGRTPTLTTVGSQMKVNMLLSRLPRLRSGVDPRTAFAGTLHIDESLSALEQAFAHGISGRVPDHLPAEIYCHTLTDPTILGPDLQSQGWHTMTLFGLHTPATLFQGGDHDRVRDRIVSAYLDAIDAFCAEPIRDCVAVDPEGQPCIEAKTPWELEESVGLPAGHIFHRDLRWPWAADDDGTPGSPDSVPGAWGVETGDANVLVCGAGARRGGGVSGIPGRAAAMAVLESDRRSAGD